MKIDSVKEDVYKKIRKNKACERNRETYAKEIEKYMENEE